MKDKDEQEPSLEYDDRLHRGLEEGSSTGHHQRVSQPRAEVEHQDAPARSQGSAQRNGERYIPPNGRQSNGSIHDDTSVQALFKGIGKIERRELLTNLAEDFS